MEGVGANDGGGPVLAVLPFTTLGGSEEDALLAQGLHEDLCGELTRFRALGVVSWVSTLAAADLPDAEVRARLGASHVLRGRLRRAEGRLQLSASLGAAAEGSQIWSERFVVPADDVFALQDEIIARIAATLHARIEESALSEARRRPTRNLAAHAMTLGGLALLREGRLAADEEARALFQRALELDPLYARAHGGIALSWFNEWSCAFWQQFHENAQRAYAHAHRALELDDRDAMLHLVVGKVLPIAPSTYHDHVAKRRDPAKLSARARRDRALRPAIARVFAENFAVYGARTVCRQRNRENIPVARCTVERLLADCGLQGVARGKPVRTMLQEKAAPCPLDHVNGQFQAPAPNRLWVSDFTYVSTWPGFVYVAFVIDAYARRIVGWRVSRTAHASFALDALEQALHERRPAHRRGLVHHSDRGSQYVGIRYTGRLAKAGIEPSVGSVGDSYDHALAETIHGLYKAEVIHRRGPRRSFEAVEFATLAWADWFNHRRLLEPIGNIPPADAEERYDARLDEQRLAA